MMNVVVSLNEAINVDDLPLDEPVGWVLIAMIGLCVIVGPWLLLLGIRRLKQAHRIFANDPVDAAAVAMEDGVVEVEGTAEPIDGTLSGKYTNEPALAQTWKRERRQERTDSDGNTETNWRTVEQGSDSIPFAVEDDSGSVAVDPSGANLSIGQSRVRDGGRIRFGSRNRRYREYEGRIEPGDGVHIYGQKREASDPADAPGDDPYYISGGNQVSEFVVSKGSELRTVFRMGSFAVFLIALSLLWIPFSLLLFLVLLGEAIGIPIDSWLVGVFS